MNTLYFFILLAAAQPTPLLADFIYADFNITTGLIFNGNADFVDCEETSEFVADDFNDNDDNEVSSSSHQHGHTATIDVFSTVETMQQNSSIDDIAIHNGVFGHREQFEVGSSAGCSERLRLTPPHPFKAGSIWYESRVPVLTGFETTFTFQITDSSSECTEHVDRSFNKNLYKSCTVHGGDGFAFVVHGDPADAAALGGDGEHLGYGGITNSLAIEFDTWTNVDTQGSDDIFQDHISIHSAGPLLPNSSNQSTSLGYWRPYDIADGQVHEAKIQYLPYVEDRYYELMTANEILIPYLKDNGEGRRLGTLAIFVDQGIIEDRPLLAIPINLSLVLDLPDSLAYVGFTASTGRKWETHDILSWSYAED